MNKVILSGNLGQSPDLRYTGNGTAVCNFSLATVERYKDKQGQKQEKTEWHKIIIWGKLAEIANEHLTTGSKVLLTGKMQTRSYDDRDGNKRYVTEVVCDELEFLGGKGDQEGGQGQQSRTGTGKNTGDQQSHGGGGYEPPFDPDDSIPF